MKRYTFLKRLIRAYRVEMIRACASAQSSSLRSNTNSRGLCLAGWILHNPIHQKNRPKRRLFLVVEMIRLELTTYTLRTYRSTG